jgi:hypothetical protein
MSRKTSESIRSETASTWSDVRETLLIAVLVLVTSTSPALAEPDLEARKGPWVGLGVGLSNVDSVELGGGQQGSFVSQDALAASVSLQAFYTTLRFDFGGLLRHMGGGEYQRPNGTEGRFGAMVSAGPFIRWRYWNTVAGPFYLQLMPAWTAAVHSDYVRRDSGVMNDLDADDIPAVTHGLSGSIDAGFLWMVNPDFALDLNLNLFFEAEIELEKQGSARLCDGAPCIEYERNRAGVRLSLFWTL